jgi:hypothetical protein
MPSSEVETLVLLQMLTSGGETGQEQAADAATIIDRPSRVAGRLQT